MHQLTIATDAATSTTGHDDFADAHRALMSHVIAQDLYLHASWPTPRTAATFKLISLDPAGREPLITGTATTRAPGEAIHVVTGPCGCCHPLMLPSATIS